MAHSTVMVQKMKSTPDDCTPLSLSNWIRKVANNCNREKDSDSEFMIESLFVPSVIGIILVSTS